jgi:hypothetical protein
MVDLVTFGVLEKPPRKTIRYKNNSNDSNASNSTNETISTKS